METQVSQTPKTHNACVYWVRLPEHTDMFSEGYVGVTRKGLDERYVPPYLFFEEAWLFYNTNPSNWLASDEIYSEIILKGGSNNLVADSLCVPVSFIKVLKKRLKRGWIPNEDPRWVKWRDEQLSLTEDTA